MRRTLVSIAIAVALVLPAGASAKDAGVHIKVTGRLLEGGNPVDIAMLAKAASGLKPLTSTNPQGEATIFLNAFANVGKKERVPVYARVCRDGKYTLILVEPGATIKARENCDDKPIGLILWADGVTVTVNTTTGTLEVSGGGGLGTGTKIGIAGGAVALLGGGLALKSGNSQGAANTPAPGNPVATPPPAPSCALFGPSPRNFDVTATETSGSGPAACQLAKGFGGIVTLTFNPADCSGFTFTIHSVGLPDIVLTGVLHSDGTFTSMGSAPNIGVSSIAITGQIKNSSLLGTQTWMDQGCTANYNYMGTPH